MDIPISRKFALEIVLNFCHLQKFIEEYLNFASLYYRSKHRKLRHVAVQLKLWASEPTEP